MDQIITITKITPWKKLPKTSGVYFFLDKQKQPLYIGKANNLFERVRSHFQNTDDPKERAICTKSGFLAWQALGSDFESLLLEANLVNQYQPKYNAQLKDDKSPLYICFTKETYPKIFLQRKNQIEKKNYRYIFGPVSSNYLARSLLRRLRTSIPFCTEKRLRDKPCFYSQLGLCDPCPSQIQAQNDGKEKQLLVKRYQKNIKRIIFILKGGGKKVLADLETEMQKQSQGEHYEQAAKLRDQWLSLKNLFNEQFIDWQQINNPDYLPSLYKKEVSELKKLLQLTRLSRVEAYDISNFAFKEATASMVVFENGLADKGQYRRFRIKGECRFDPEMLLEVLKRRLKHKEWPTPDLLILDGGAVQLRKVFPELKYQYPNLPKIIGIAKKPDRLCLPEVDKEKVNYRYLNLDKNSLALHYVVRLRDEAHRFAKKYHRLLRSQSLL